jgi:probable rRNA maturation factor
MNGSDFCTIINKTKGRLPSLPFVSIKNKILGEKYDLSISFVSAKKQKEMNRIYRKINKTTNVLSFPFSKSSGEITFDLSKIKKEVKLFNMTYRKLLTYLLIHGCLHLKGFEHSSTMEKEEKKFLDLFSR